MSNSNKAIVFASILGAILATGLLALSPSTMIGNAQAQMYANEYGYDSNNYNDYNHEPKKSSHVDIQKIKCVNSNINVNGIDITQIPTDESTAAEAANEGADAIGAQNGNGWGDKINFERNLVNICVNVNVNEQVKVSTPEEDGSPCEDCFSGLTENQIASLLRIVDATSIGAYCDRLLDTPDSCQETDGVIDALERIDLTPQEVSDIINCLVDAGVIDPACV